MDKLEQLPRPWNQPSRASSRPSGGTGGCLAVFVLLGFLCLSSLGCGNSSIEPPGGEPTQDTPVPPPPPPLPVGTSPSGTSVLLQVVSDSGSPVAGAAVSSQGAVYPVEATAVVEVQEGAHVGARVTLLQLANPISFEAEQGGIIQTEQVRVTIPPGAVVDALGQPVTGTVNVTIASLDPTRQLEAMPGPLEGTTVEDGERVQLESFFLGEVSLGSNGAPVQLAPGKSATLEFVLLETLASQFQAGDTVPAWWLDLEEGRWREEGEGSIQPSSTQPGKLAWVVQVKHFTWWNCDAPWTDKSCVNVLVVDGSGAPVRGIEVNAQVLS